MIRQLPGTEKISLINHFFSNIYLIESESGLMIVDTGIMGSTGKVLRKIKELGYIPQDLHTILLTHAHFDHFGSAAALQARTGAAIAAHEVDLPNIEKGGFGIIPPPFNLIPDFTKFLARLFGLPPVKIERSLVDGDQIGEWHVIHTPGHTPGSISFYTPQSKVLITGGWAIDRKLPSPRKQRSGYSPVRLFSSNPSEIINSQLRLAQLDFQTLLCSHLQPRYFPFYAQQLRAMAGKEAEKNHL